MFRHAYAGTVLTMAAAVAVAVVAVALPAPTAGAAAASECTSSTGTVVAVDFAHWDGPVVRGCDTSEPATGAELLTDAGFSLSGTQHDGPAFVCRIGNAAYNRGRQYPTVRQDPCVLTPPATAYWSYWLAAPGSNRWTYSSWGAYAEQSRPKAGGVELWIFGGTRTEGSDATPVDGFPTCTPSSLRAGGSPRRCTPRNATSGAMVPKRIRSTRPSAPRTHHASPPRPASAVSTTKHPTSAAAVPLPVSRTSAPKTSSPVVEAGPAAATRPAHGSPVPVVVTLGVVALLLGGGGVTVWRRRRAAQ